jgi:hypothetical protein
MRLPERTGSNTTAKEQLEVCSEESGCGDAYSSYGNYVGCLLYLVHLGSSTSLWRADDCRAPYVEITVVIPQPCDTSDVILPPGGSERRSEVAVRLLRLGGQLNVVDYFRYLICIRSFAIGLLPHQRERITPWTTIEPQDRSSIASGQSNNDDI